METWKKREETYKGKILSLWTGEVQIETGETFYREIVEHVGGVAIVPVVGDSVILVRQFRIAVGRSILELPAGKLERGELPEVCAQRELAEEIGYRADNLIHATTYYASVGFTDEQMHIYLGFGLHQAAQSLDSDEAIEIVPVPIVEIEGRLARKEFEDAKTIIGLRELLAYLENHPKNH